MENIYDRIGGKDSFKAAVDELYKRILAGTKINHYFPNIDMATQRKHMTAFMIMTFGCPQSYRGRSMKEGDKRLPLKQADFDDMASHLKGTLESLSIPENTLNEIMVTVDSLKDDIIEA